MSEELSVMESALQAMAEGTPQDSFNCNNVARHAVAELARLRAQLTAAQAEGERVKRSAEVLANTVARLTDQLDAERGKGAREALDLLCGELEGGVWAQVKPDGTSAVGPERDSFADGYQFAVGVAKGSVQDIAGYVTRRAALARAGEVK